MEYWFNAAYEFPHLVVLKAANEERLLKVSKLATLNLEVTSWLEENIGFDMYTHAHGILSFKAKEDAMAFMLRWQ